MRNIWSTIREKDGAGQADRIVLNLDDSGASLDALRSQFRDWPIDGLKEVLIVRGGAVVKFFPF